MSDASSLRHSGEITLVRVAAGDRISPGPKSSSSTQRESFRWLRKGQQHHAPILVAFTIQTAWQFPEEFVKKFNGLTETDGRKRYLSHVATICPRQKLFENKFKRIKVITLCRGILIYNDDGYFKEESATEMSV